MRRILLGLAAATAPAGPAPADRIVTRPNDPQATLGKIVEVIRDTARMPGLLRLPVARQATDRPSSGVTT